MLYREWYSADVYLVTSQTSHCKIGVSQNVGGRIYQLQRIANEYMLGQLSLKHCFYSPYSMMWERFFHVLFDHRRSVGLPGCEWFSLAESEIALFCDMPDKIAVSPMNTLFWREHWNLDTRVKSVYEAQQSLAEEA